MGPLSRRISDCVFYGIADTGYVAREAMFSKCEQMADTGAGIIQLRAKNEDPQTRRSIALGLLPLFRKRSDVIFIINDDIALAAEICSLIPNAGLHIGQDDGPPEDARREIGEGRALGLSTHSQKQAAEACAMSGILDYFAVGPVYATGTKPGREPVGLGLVRKVAASAPALPWFCIGGVNAQTARAVRNAGGRRIVAVSGVLVPDDTAGAVKSLVAEFLGR